MPCCMQLTTLTSLIGNSSEVVVSCSAKHDSKLPLQQQQESPICNRANLSTS